MKTLLSISLFFVLLILPFDAFADSLEVSKSGDFSTSDRDFSGGENVHVRISAPSASKHVLNVRDNNYSLLEAIQLNRNGSVYTTSFSAPNEEGYYSLEAKIEGGGSSVTSVKTIKVGSGGNAGVKVNVQSGNSVISENSDNSDNSENSENSEIPENSENSDELENSEVHEETQKYEAEASGNWIWSTIRGIFLVIWPF